MHSWEVPQAWASECARRCSRLRSVLHTDHCGPYKMSHGGALFSTVLPQSTFKWAVRMPKKSGAGKALELVIADAAARSGRALRFLKTMVMESFALQVV